MSQNFLKPITACFHKPVAENPTRVMIEAAYRDLGLDWRYVTLEVDPADLAAAVAGASAMGFRGFSCTMPTKSPSSSISMVWVNLPPSCKP